LRRRKIRGITRPKESDRFKKSIRTETGPLKKEKRPGRGGGCRRQRPGKKRTNPQHERSTSTGDFGSTEVGNERGAKSREVWARGGAGGKDHGQGP